MSLASYPLLPSIKTIRKPPTDTDLGDLDAIKAVNNLIVTVEKSCQVGMNNETFITQSGGKIFETKGKEVPRSLQSTLLLQSKKLLKSVEKDLEEKRIEFKNRMEACREKQLEIDAKHKALRDRVKKFERFLKENDIKKNRATEKAASERSLREQKEAEFVGLRKQMVVKTLRVKSLKKQIKGHKEFEKYLQSVLNVLPPNYLDVNEPQIIDILTRYKTLKETRQDLETEVQANQDSVLKSEAKLQKLIKDNNDFILINTSTLATQQKLLEKKRTENQSLQEEIDRKNALSLERMRMLSETKLAIDDMYERIKAQNNRRVMTSRKGTDTNSDARNENDPKVWLFKLHALQFRIKDLSDIVGQKK